MCSGPHSKGVAEPAFEPKKSQDAQPLPSSVPRIRCLMQCHSINVSSLLFDFIPTHDTLAAIWSSHQALFQVPSDHKTSLHGSLTEETEGEWAGGLRPAPSVGS